MVTSNYFQEYTTLSVVGSGVVLTAGGLGQNQHFPTQLTINWNLIQILGVFVCDRAGLVINEF